jgi:hypothetical protein
MTQDLWLLAVTERGQWRLGIGDPTPIGWFTVFAYFAAVAACLANWAGERKVHRRGFPANPGLWLVLSALLLFLGINKQLDLQTLFGNVARNLAVRQGWYPERRFYQILFIQTLGVAGLAGVAVLGWSVRKHLARSLLPLAGTIFLYVFVLTRASSFHNVDVLLRTGPSGIPWNWIFELGGIGIVGLGAFLAWKLRARLGKVPDSGRARASRDATGAQRYTFVKGVLVRRED